MKNKSKIQTPSTSLLNDSNHYSSYLSKDISFNDIKKDSLNKYYSRNYKKPKSRQMNSLDELTQKFMRYVYNSARDKKSDLINLNTVMKNIKAKKRRIYDITNCLEGKEKSIYIIYKFIGIGIINKFAKNQIILKKEFFELYENNQKNNIIFLDEEEYKEKNTNSKNEKNKDEIKELDNEIKYVEKLDAYMNEKLSSFNPNIINNLDILDLNLNLNIFNKNINNSNNNNNKTINLITKKHDQNIKVDPTIFFDPNNIFQLLENDSELNTNKILNLKNTDIKQQKDKKESLVGDKKENPKFSIHDEFEELFKETNNNENEKFFALNDNKDDSISFISNDSFNFHWEKDN